MKSNTIERIVDSIQANTRQRFPDMILSGEPYERVQAAIASKGFEKQSLGLMLRQVTKAHADRIMTAEYADFEGAAFAKKRLFDAATYMAQYAVLDSVGLDTGRTRYGFEQKLGGKLYDEYEADFLNAVERITSDIMRSIERNMGGIDYERIQRSTDERQNRDGASPRTTLDGSRIELADTTGNDRGRRYAGADSRDGQGSGILSQDNREFSPGERGTGISARGYGDGTDRPTRREANLA
jgi:hypothetical protein